MSRGFDASALRKVFALQKRTHRDTNVSHPQIPRIGVSRSGASPRQRGAERKARIARRMSLASFLGPCAVLGYESTIDTPDPPVGAHARGYDG